MPSLQLQDKNIFQNLLETDPVEALNYREKELVQKSQQYRLAVESSKTVSLAAFVLLAGMSSVPVILFLSALPGLAYVYTVIEDWYRTKKIFPVPVFRQSVDEMIQGAVAVKDGDKTVSHPYQNVVEYLEPEEAHEYSFILQCELEVAGFLKKVFPNQHRARVYNYLRKLLYISGEVQIPAPQVIYDAMVETYGITIDIEDLSLSTAKTLPQLKKGVERLPEVVENLPSQVESEDPYLDVSTIPFDSGNNSEDAVSTVEDSVEEPVEEPVEDSVEEVEKLNIKGSSTRLVGVPIKENILKLPMKERMLIMLEALEKQGFPLGKLVYAPMIKSVGPSQTGKSTIVHLLAIARMAIGIPVEYSTPDESPHIAFDKLWGQGENWDSVADSYNTATSSITSATKESPLNRAYHFDEVYRVADHNIDASPILKVAIQKGAKVKAFVVFITQDGTLTHSGLKVGREALDNSCVMIYPNFSEDSLGMRSPTGEYKVVKNGSESYWKIPDWLYELSDDDGRPDPVKTFLSYFPELAGKPKEVAIQSQPATEIKNILQKKVLANPQPKVESTVVKPVDSEDQRLVSLMHYIERKKAESGSTINLSTLKNSWGRNYKTGNERTPLSSSEVESLVKKLIETGKISEYSPGVYF